MRSVLLAVAVGLGGLACGSDAGAVGDDASAVADSGAPEPPDAAPSEPEEICDGSQEIRFGYDFVDPTTGFVQYPFFEVYGPEFLFVRGDCHYVYGGSYDGIEFREGDLTREQAEQLASEVDFATLGKRFVRAKDDPCWDQPTQRIHGPSSTFSCRCCGAFHPVSQIARGLAGEGTAVDGAVTAAATFYPRPEPELERASWPLDTDVSELEVATFKPGPDDGRRFEDPADTAALRGLRNARRRDDWLPTSVAVEAGDGRVFSVSIRDELPAGMEGPVLDLLQDREDQR